MKRVVDVGLLLTISTLWAGAVLLSKIDVAAFPPMTLGAWRATIAAAGILLFCVVTKQALGPAFKKSRAMLLLAVVGIASTWTLVPAGEQFIGSGLATLMSALLPASALLFSALPPIRAKVGWKGWMGLVVGGVGLLLAIGPAHILKGDAILEGASLAGLGFVMFGIYCVLTERLAKGIAPSTAAGVMILYAAAVLWVLAFVFESPTMVAADREEWWAMFGMALPGTAVPNLLVFVLVARAGGVFMSFNGYTMPLIGILLAYLVFGTVPAWTLVVGVPLVFAGMALVQRARAGGGAS
ncbi:MAG: DMT family transporter [Verrucomicrobiota bacterium]